MLFPDTPSPAPSYLVRPVYLGWLPATYFSREICIHDFDEAFFAQDAPGELPHIPIEYLAPEAIFALRNGPTADVWAFGCILVALRTTWVPFLSFMGARPLSTVLRLQDLLGSLPQEWTSFPFRDGCPVHGPLEPGIDQSTIEDFRKSGPDSLEALSLDVLQPRMPPGVDAFHDGIDRVCLPLLRSDRTGSRAKFEKEWLVPIDKDDAAFTDLLRRIFTYDDQNRLTARQVLEHPWRKEVNLEPASVPDLEPAERSKAGDGLGRRRRTLHGARRGASTDGDWKHTCISRVIYAACLF